MPRRHKYEVLWIEEQRKREAAESEVARLTRELDAARLALSAYRANAPKTVDKRLAAQLGLEEKSS